MRIVCQTIILYLIVVFATDLSDFKISTDESYKELKQSIVKANKLKEKKIVQWDINTIARSIKQEPLNEGDAMEEDPTKSSIILNATAEFCRTLGDIPTYGMAGNRDEDEDELMVINLEMGFVCNFC